MKKLALALVCLVSVAFFASCEQPKGQPSIAVLQEEGYVKDGDVVNLGEEVNFGFVMATSPESNSLLKSLIIKIDDEDADTIAIQGTEYTYRGVITYNLSKDEIVGNSTIIATVYDATGEYATTSIKLSINEPAQPLVSRTIEWARRGSNLQGDTQAEMAAVGLQWVARDAYHANIRPLGNCTLYVIENNLEAFEGVVTDVDKAACFAELQENAQPVEEYRNISVAVTGDKTYNDILAVIDANGNKHLVLFEAANVQTGSFGVHTTIKGQVK